MPSSTSPASSRSAASSSLPSQHGRQSSSHSVPVETLVQHLLDAKRSLSSIRLVLRANDLVHSARQAHQESVILSSQSHFLRHGITDQLRLLLRLRRGMNRSYETGKREFKHIIKTLDTTNGRLEHTINVLQGRHVEPSFRPPDEERRNLLDFVDELQVDTMRNALKDNIQTLQATQKSFDGDLLRFDTDMRSLNKIMTSAPTPASPSASSTNQSLPDLLSSMITNSHAMAELLTSLTKHFDLCVTAVRTTQGGAALARIKAAEATESQGGEDISISGVIAEQDTHNLDFDPISPEDRDQMLEVVVQDASEVEDVVQELNERLQSMESDFAALDHEANQINLAYLSTLDAFRALEDIGSRLTSYIAAEAEFRDRWSEEQQAIEDKMEEMEGLRNFYENYASSYDGLILEVERRKTLEEKVFSIWKKAKDSVDKVIERDRQERDLFRQEVAEYLPTDLWPGLDEGMPTWEVVPVQDEKSSSSGPNTTPALEKSIVQAAAMRLGRTTGQR
ncbi:kinase activator [Xylariomycetidae sp. FL2044]|nr:kinase activator [Xylariomycetidae sp. FL2044]